MARDYSKGKIYKIMVSTEEEYLPYVGSTTKQYLSQRMEKHRSSYKRWKNSGKGFVSAFTLFEKFGIENCYIELIELCPCSCSDELRKKERELFDKLECCNKNKPYASKEELKEYEKTRIKDKEQISKIKKKYYEQNKDKINEKGKEYYEANKEVIIEKSKEYHEQNREQILEKWKEKYTCDCGSTLRKKEKTRHEKTKKHQLFIHNINF